MGYAMPHLLVADKIAEAGLERLRAMSSVTFDGNPRVLVIDGYRMELVPERSMALKLDEPMSDSLREAMQAASPPILAARTVELPPVAKGNDRT